MNQAKLRAQQARTRRVARVRARISGTPERPRISTRRTLRHISAQLIDDTSGKTIVAATDVDVKKTKNMKPVEVAREVGKTLASRAVALGLKKAVFDRRDKKYHGRVQALADGAREGGLEL
jgi:large subunit ribosomal protein L18